MRVLVTGANGFVGKHVVAALHADKHEITVPTREQLDLMQKRGSGFHVGMEDSNTEVSFIRWFLLEHRIEAIVHLAAVCGGIGINKDNPGKFIYENLQMGINLLESARLAGVKKIVNLGTVCSYPKYTPVPFKEESLWDGYPEETNAPYGIAKKAVMEMAIAYHKQYGLNVTNLLPANMAGEYDHFDTYSSHVIPALIKKFAEAEKHPQVGIVTTNSDGSITKELYSVVELWGTGTASREFLYAGDCAKAIVLSLERDTGPEPINLGTGREVTIADLATMIKEIGRYNADIMWDHSKPDGQPRRSLDTSRAKERLGWEATTTLEETIKRTIEWYRSQ